MPKTYVELPFLDHFILQNPALYLGLSCMDLSIRYEIFLLHSWDLLLSDTYSSKPLLCRQILSTCPVDKFEDNLCHYTVYPL